MEKNEKEEFMNPYENLKVHIKEIERELNYIFKDSSLLILAFVHRSFVNENKKITPEHNERLEFLGDSILGSVVAELLYHLLPSEHEGKLSNLRASLVDANSCAEYLQKLKVDSYVLLGKGEQFAERGKKTILADVFEAIVGAIYLDGGYDNAKKFIEKQVKEKLDEILVTPMQNYKAVLQEKSQKEFGEIPHYQVLKETGPDHSKTFFVAVFIKDKEYGLGEGNTKKEAEQIAAKMALERIQTKT
jgi:ribonuclease-3